MKKIFLFTISLAFLTLSCEKFDDISRNPYALDDAPAEEYVHPIVFKTQYSMISVFRSITAPMMQYGVSTNSEVSSRVVDNYNIPESLTDDIWIDLYTQYGNAAAMYNKAVSDQDDAMQAVALILKSFLITQISDAYGEVPFKEAGLLSLRDDLGVYTMAYDTQKDIYRDVICMLEDANEILAATTQTRFSAVCDKTFGGDLEKWRRFGNSLYARVLMRIGMKVIEEDGGLLELNEKWEAVAIKSKLGELYSCFVSGGGDYPQMRSRADRPMVPFSSINETEHTPFYTITSGTWNSLAVCDVLTRAMLDYNQKTDSNGIVYYEYKASSAGGHIEDPRYDCWWRKANGMPAQLINTDRIIFLDAAEHKSAAGNSKIGRMTYGREYPSALTGKEYDLQNADYYTLMSFSELPFIYAEAGARGWVNAISGIGAYLALFRQGITESILEWNPYVSEGSEEVVEYVNYCVNGATYGGSTFNSSNAVNAIISQKWLANFFIGIESWCDYRRTGYPVLRTDGPAAENDNILPTRLRYPADELYRNPVTYPATLDRWLGGTNNSQTDVWWASTAESYQNRLLGRQ